MRAIVQRVSAATVRVDAQEVGRCGSGLMLLVGVHRDDTEANAEKLADRIFHLRIFSDPEGRMNLAIKDFPEPPPGPRFAHEVLAVSNFTVYGDTSQRRPSFTQSAPYEQGERLFHHFVSSLRALDVDVQTGKFGAHMEVSLINDGPVTVLVDV